MQAPTTGLLDETIAREEVSVRRSALPLGQALVVTILLSCDELNPVKIFNEYIPWVSNRTIAIVALVNLLVLCFTQRQRLLYFVVRLFFRCTLNNMFFRSVEIVGAENLPKEGPLILTGNHNNQFVDGIMMVANCAREISFMIAQKSFERPVVGTLARALRCIPVTRPQDTAKSGSGKVKADGSCTLLGVGTAFTKEAIIGGSLDIKGQSGPIKVKEVKSDTELILDSAATETPEEGAKYKVLPKVDQSKMYSNVFNSLGKGDCLGIFPEGGSHDRTDLLPLKAGVAIIALEMYKTHQVSVPIQPVGLNYFGGHHFGGRVVVEFGAPIHIPQEVHLKYETDKRGATADLLELVTSGMRSVIVPVPDYKTLQKVYMMRRLFAPDNERLSASEIMDLNRRFAVGARRIIELRRDSQEGPGSPTGKEDEDHQKAALGSEDLQALGEVEQQMDEYMHSLKRLGLRDHQVRQIPFWTFGDLCARVLYFTMTMGLGIVPHIMFNLPVIMIARKFAATEQAKALKASTVKLAARDVVMSYKIIYVLVLVPLEFIVYGSLLFKFTQLWMTTKILLLASCPFFAFLAMKASEQGIREAKNIYPLLRHIGSMSGLTKTEQDMLPKQRIALQKEVRKAVKKYGPALGDLYSAKTVDWNKEMSKLNRSLSNAELMQGLLEKSGSPARKESTEEASLRQRK
eukprot:TRINITY_DN1254_c0_g1_i1.p1 TRINITY_DN1254_c0_g1~~TRINITY_DN1254_c0_g1_i1.p1  ORF type:complete len:688 (-),score=131.68 TRINITY_DN1254_c0_g1_i1:337-2400(-)